MSDIKLFRTSGDTVSELEPEGFHLEKSLQALIERHLETFVGVRFLATEYSTGARHAGRIDTLGLDENGCPVIIEYKRSSNENVINQGLFYLDWLLDHKAEFQLLVMRELRRDASEAIEWSSPRLLCIAQDFTRYDEHAVQQINRNIELIRYRRYGDDLLLLDLVNQTRTASTVGATSSPVTSGTYYKSVTEYIADADEELTDRYEALRAFCLSLGDDVQEKTLKHYVAFKRLKNFACVEVHTKTRNIMVFLKVPPEEVDTEDDPMLRDMRGIGHYGTGDLELTVGSMEDLRRAEPLIQRSY
ncbi:MAG TPA: DUF91 domain-containing protein, partial [Rhodothermales bacterium]|nr:DUF91 domain-containing protein [Rhodothermales bacterium]